MIIREKKTKAAIYFHPGKYSGILNFIDQTGRCSKYTTRQEENQICEKGLIKKYSIVPEQV